MLCYVQLDHYEHYTLTNLKWALRRNIFFLLHCVFCSTSESNLQYLSHIKSVFLHTRWRIIRFLITSFYSFLHFAPNLPSHLSFPNSSISVLYTDFKKGSLENLTEVTPVQEQRQCSVTLTSSVAFTQITQQPLCWVSCSLRFFLLSMFV